MQRLRGNIRDTKGRGGFVLEDPSRGSPDVGLSKISVVLQQVLDKNEQTETINDQRKGKEKRREDNCTVLIRAHFYQFSEELSEKLGSARKLGGG